MRGACGGGYLSEQRYKAREVFDTQTRDYYLGFGDVLGFMLLGMGMFRNGFLTAKLKTKTYVTFRGRRAWDRVATRVRRVLDSVEEPLRSVRDGVWAVSAV